MPQKRYLLTPGPTPVPPEVLAALAEPVIHHRSPDFKTVFLEANARLQRGLPNGERRARLHVVRHRRVRVGVRESALAGREGARRLARGVRLALAEARRRGRCEVVALTYEWGQAPVAEDVARALAESGAGVAFIVHSETSTGVVSDIRSLVAACNDAGAISVVDAISSLGAVPLETDAWGIDVVVTGSQKALMTPPGLAFASISERAWAKAAAGDVAALLLGLGARPGRLRRRAARRSRRPPRPSSPSTRPSS